jgi:hypothetical protein
MDQSPAPPRGCFPSQGGSCFGGIKIHSDRALPLNSALDDLPRREPDGQGAFELPASSAPDP